MIYRLPAIHRSLTFKDGWLIDDDDLSLGAQGKQEQNDAFSLLVCVRPPRRALVACPCFISLWRETVEEGEEERKEMIATSVSAVP